MKKLPLLLALVLLAGCAGAPPGDLVPSGFAPGALMSAPGVSGATPPLDEPSDGTGEALRDPRVTLTISAVGDCTLGNSPARDNAAGSYIHTFNRLGQDYDYFLRNVRRIFEDDDLTVANLEIPLTDATEEREAEFRFRGRPDFYKILSGSSVEAVNLANNHTMDLLQQGYDDTKANLELGGVLYVEDGKCTFYETKGFKIGLISFCYNYSQALAALRRVRGECDLVIIIMHAGTAYSYRPHSVQIANARAMIDAGADAVIGHHPHVLQGLEFYKGRYIAYSLGNFSYGGHSNPPDYDTMILRLKFTFEDGVLLPELNDFEVVPCSVSSITAANNYQPTPLKGAEIERFVAKFNEFSDVKIDGKISAHSYSP